MEQGIAKKDRLLIIDDEFGPRESLRFVFKDLYDVTLADSVDKGVAFLKEMSPDTIIMDIRMPGKTGIQGLQEIRAIDQQVSIIMLTGFGSLETAQEAIRHGATDYLKKPFDTEEIREVVQKYVERTKMHRQRTETTSHLETLTAQLQDQLAEKETMASLGEESSEFIHDLSSPLTVINGYANILLMDIKEKRSTGEEMTASYLEQIEKSVNRCREMLTLWRQRATRNQSSTQTISIPDLVTEVAQNAKAIAAEKKNGSVILEAGPDCSIEGDNLQIFRSVQNIVNNAIDALPDQNGCVTVSWSLQDNMVAVAVRDNGCGIPPDKINDLQKKHFTTKQKSGGMGLGLFITKNIAEAHGGSLTLSNNETPPGACVTLTFPLLK